MISDVNNKIKRMPSLQNSLGQNSDRHIPQSLQQKKMKQNLTQNYEIYQTPSSVNGRATNFYYQVARVREIDTFQQKRDILDIYTLDKNLNKQNEQKQIKRNVKITRIKRMDHNYRSQTQITNTPDKSFTNAKKSVRFSTKVFVHRFHDIEDSPEQQRPVNK